MKQKDIALIIVVAFISAIASFFVSNKQFVAQSNRAQEVEVVDPIDASFKTPDKKYFNSNSIDPAPSTQISTDTNQNPFNGGSQ